MTLQKVLLPTKPVVGGLFQGIRIHGAYGRWSFTAAGVKGVLKRCHLSYRFGNIGGWFLHMRLLLVGESPKWLAKVFSTDSL